MNSETFGVIKTNIEEIGSFFSFLKKGKLKQEVFLSLDSIEAELCEIPNLQKDLEESKIKHNELEIEFKTYQDKSKDEYLSLEDSFSQHKEESKKLIENKQSHIEEISSNLEHMKNKQRLVSSLLSSKSDNEGLKEYKRVLNNDFIEFANYEESLANEAEAILKLQAIEKELEVITAYPDLHKKNTVAVGGGFSAGKSEFISSFFYSGIKLPIGINPTTAIPTYVMSTKENKVIACSNNGGIVDLKKIDDDFHSKLSHDFIKSFDFNLKEIMPLMIVGTKIEQENICFIDTPGYNPPNSDETYTQEDIYTAKEFLSNASTFIWLIGADVNGTIPSSDIDFLSELDLENKNLYIVLNKADLRSETDIFEIVEEIRNSLNDYDINYCGISSYSSIEKKEYSFISQSLTDFINNCNYESKVHAKMIKKLYEVHSMYKKAILTNIKEKEAIKSQIKSISLDLLEEGFDDITKPVFQRLEKLSRIYSTKKQEKNLKSLDIVIKKLKNAIDKVFECESEIDFDDIKANEIEINFDFTIENIENEEIVFETKKKKVQKNTEKEEELLKNELNKLHNIWNGLIK